MIKAVIFDIDGTLVDSVDLHARAWQEALEHFGKRVPFENVRQQIGKGGDQLLPVFLNRQELDQFGEDLEEYRAELFKRDYLPKVKGFPLVRELFQLLRANGKKIGLASSAKEEELTVYKRIADIEDLIEQETSADDVERSKPHPDIFHTALEVLKVDAAEAVAIGDTPYDAEAAARAGLSTIGVLCGGFQEFELVSAGCIEIYRDPSDILVHFDETFIMQTKERLKATA